MTSAPTVASRPAHPDECAWAQGSLTLDVRTRLDGRLARIAGRDGALELRLADGALAYEVRTSGDDGRWALLEAEDVRPLTDGGWHSVAVVVDARGTRLFVDGYQVFAGTVDVFLAGLGDDVTVTVGDARIQTRTIRLTGDVLDATTLLADAVAPRPLVEFAAATLAPHDTARVAELAQGSVAVRFRVRGPGQGGTLLAAAVHAAVHADGPDTGTGRERLRLEVTDAGLRYVVRAAGSAAERDYLAPGSWADGAWHDVVLTAARGAVEVYVDGYQMLHAPGQSFFADAGRIETVTIGQDTRGVRLWGEVSRGGIYDLPLNDSQVKRLAGVAPLETVAVFDRGLGGAVSYRIPSLLRTPAGTLVAGADRRTSIANDSPNHIEFVVRRSEDDGRSWVPVQTVITSHGAGASGASVIDSCSVIDTSFEDGHTRIVVLIDHFPGGIGQPNSAYGVGVTDAGTPTLLDADGRRYGVDVDGTVTGEDGEATGYRVDLATGLLSRDGRPLGHIDAAAFEALPGALRREPTCYLQMVHSDDDGLTWHGPFELNHQVKEPWMAFLGTGPGTGIQLRRGPHAGRLVMPVYYNAAHPKVVSCAVVYSDDHGTTWQRGASPNDGRRLREDGPAIDSATVLDEDAALHENTVVERADGSILMLMRNQHPSGRVMRTVSTDGGQSWRPVEPVEELPEIFCQPNAVTLDGEGDDIVFVNASAMLPYRGRGVVRHSSDGGRTWPHALTINPGHHVYQSMAVLPDGDLALLWEHEWQGLYLTRIPVGLVRPDTHLASSTAAQETS